MNNPSSNKGKRYFKATGFNGEPVTVDTVGFDPVKSMRITPLTDSTSLYSTGNIETSGDITSHEIRGDYSKAVGRTPDYGPNTYHKNMFDEDPDYIHPLPPYTPLSNKEKSELLNNMQLNSKHGAGKTKKKNNKKSKKNKSKRKKIMRKIHSKKQRGSGKTRKNKKSKRKTRK